MKNKIAVKSYMVLGIALISISLVIILTASAIFNSMKTANEVDEDLLNSASPLINQNDLKKASDAFTNKTAPPIDSL